MGARARVVALALWAAALGCAESPPDCAQLVAVHAFPEGELCDVTAAGYFLRTDGDELVLGRASSSTVAEVARVAGRGCGSLAHDPDSGTIWIASASAEAEGPSTLHELGEDGEVRGELALEYLDTGKAVQIEALLAHAGKLYVGGALVDSEISEGETRRAFLQRRGPGGMLDWTLLDYADAHPSAIEVAGAFNSLDSLVGHDVGVSFLARRWGIGASYDALVTVTTEGALVWSAVARPEGVLGPSPKLASDGARLYLSEERQAVRDADWTTLIEKARELVTAYSSVGSSLWDSRVSWSDLREVDTSNAARAGGELFTSMSGANADDERQVWITHYADGDGELLCSSLVEEDGLYAAHTLRGLASGELAMLAVAGAPDEHGNAPDHPEPQILIFALIEPDE